MDPEHTELENNPRVKVREQFYRCQRRRLTVFTPDVGQTWLGHADAGFTLRTYVHLLEEGVGTADFLDDAVEVSRGPWTEGPERV